MTTTLAGRLLRWERDGAVVAGKRPQRTAAFKAQVALVVLVALRIVPGWDTAEHAR
jgi:hypothetical protein